MLINIKEKVGKPSETDSIKSKITSKTSRGKKDSTKRHHHRHQIDSQVNSNFPYRWSPARLIFNNYFYIFLYLYITRPTINIININTPHLKSPKQKSRLGTASNEITGEGGGGGGGGLRLACGQNCAVKLLLEFLMSCLKD